MCCVEAPFYIFYTTFVPFTALFIINLFIICEVVLHAAALYHALNNLWTK